MALKYVSFQETTTHMNLSDIPFLMYGVCHRRHRSGEAQLDPLLITVAFREDFSRGCGWVWAGPELSDRLASTHQFVFSCTTVVIVK